MGLSGALGQNPEPDRRLVGTPVSELPTPALVLDRQKANHNITHMARLFEDMPTALRPHVKVHKSPELARAQVEAGAIGVTVATVREAEAMINGGIEDVLIANQVVPAPWLDLLVGLAARATVTVAVDDPANVDRLAERPRRADVEVGALVEVDVGMGRAGARSLDEALALAARVDHTSGLTLRGLMGYEGHCADIPDPGLRAAETERALKRVLAVADAARERGLSVDVVSSGSTGTHSTAGRLAGITEIQAGSYVLMDDFHAGLVEGFRFSLTVASTVTSVHGGLAVLDAGRKAVGNDLRSPLPPDGGDFAFIHEEHIGFRFPGAAPFAVGDVVRLVPGYAPSAVNHFDAYFVAEENLIVDVWPVCARHGI